MRKLNLHHWIFIGMVAGLLLGLVLNYLTYIPPGGTAADALLNPEGERFRMLVWWFDLLGTDIFIGVLKMIIAPLIFASIVAGITSLPGMGELGSIGIKSFAYYATTTTLAVALGLIVVLTIQPGKKAASITIREQRSAEIEAQAQELKERIPEIDLSSEQGQAQLYTFLAEKKGEQLVGDSKWMRVAGAKETSFGEMFRRDILLPILTTPFASLAANNSLGVIFFSILTGLACLALGDRAAPVTTFFKSMNEVMMQITLWVMAIAPVSILCLVASLVSTLGLDALTSVGWYCLCVIIGIVLHTLLLLTIVMVFGRMNPFTFVKGIRNAWLIALSTKSSAATLPVTLECVVDNLKVSPKIANFALPVGATCNMDGTALYEGVAVIFLIQIFGGLADCPIELSMSSTFIIFITAVLASVGAAAVPSAGLVTMAIVAGAVGLPLYYIPLIFAVDHLLDMFRTATNVLGDAVGTVVVNHWERSRLGEGPVEDAV